MSRYSKLEVLNFIYKIRMIPIYYHPNFELSIDIAKSCVEGGARLLEFTNRGSEALETFKKMENYFVDYLPEAVLGIGSILDAPTAAMFIEAGANFVVGPCFDHDVAKLCNKKKVPYFPGCGSVSEIHQAHAHGADICKIFPAMTVGGPDFVKSVLSPIPWASLMPTGGVTTEPDNLKSWFDAGVVCVGLGSQLISKKIIEEKKFDKLKKEVQATVKLIKGYL